MYLGSNLFQRVQANYKTDTLSEFPFSKIAKLSFYFVVLVVVVIVVVVFVVVVVVFVVVVVVSLITNANNIIFII